MLEFMKIQQAVGRQFAAMSDKHLYKVDIDRDEIVRIYLDSIPAEHNLMYRKAREYDCSCCKQFLREAGSAVTIVDNELVSIFDGDAGDEVWNDVLSKLSAYVKSRPIVGYWYSESKMVGADKTFEQLVEDVHVWSHFYVTVPKQFIKPRQFWGSMNGDASTRFSVFRRALEELTDEAVDIVIELSQQNSLYRGAECLPLLQIFKDVKAKYKLAKNKDLFVWESLLTTNPAVIHIRNSATGTLLINLSDGEDVDVAVRKYEVVVAPANYQRPTALVTQKQIDAAKIKVEELGLLSALTRRHACQTDITVNDVLYVDRSIKKSLGGTLFEDLKPTRPASARYTGTEEIGIDDFISNVLPHAEKLELLIENRHRNNLVSLIAPTDPTANRLFKWDNNFSWTYTGNVADSIKEKVKKAGGNVTGELCCRLSWHNFDDLDFHLVTEEQQHIYYGNKRDAGGSLDVDMNAFSGTTREPVENIFWSRLSSVPAGRSKLYVQQFSKRETTNVGFEVEIEIRNEVYNFAYPNAVSGIVEIAYIDKDAKGNVFILPLLPLSTANTSLWGVTTNNYVPVELMCYSPNFWGNNKIGNKHYIFALKDCKNPDEVRGFMNEYLDSRLSEHRKVFELLGNKTLAPYSENQISGLGFSSTLRNSIVCRVTGAVQRTLTIKF